MKTDAPLGGQIVAGTLSGFKAARLVVCDDGGLVFGGAGLGTTYSALDIATCVHVREHVPPHPGCACGFYATKSAEKAASLVFDDCPALLQVSLWGGFHEFEDGFIAAVQRVERVTLQPYCWQCLTRLQGRNRAAVVLVPLGSERGTALQPACDEHANDAENRWPLSRVAEALQVPTGWADDDHHLTGAIQALGLNYRRPRRPPCRRLDDVLPGETVHVFANQIARDEDGTLFINPLARLVQPLPGTDVPLRLEDDGYFVVDLDGLDRPRWRPRHDSRKFSLPLRVLSRTEDGGPT